MLKKAFVTVVTVFIIFFNALSIKAADKPVELDKDYVKIDKESDKIIFDEANNGIFFVDYDKNDFFDKLCKIYYYDIKNNKYSEVISTDAIYDCYYDSEYIYLLRKKETKKISNVAVKYFYEVIRINRSDYSIKKIALPGIKSRVGSQNCSFGVDHSGKIYLYNMYNNLDMKIYVFSKSGKLLTSKKTKLVIDQFYGFDKTNGNFYYGGVIKTYSWGYINTTACLMAGNLSSKNKLTMPEANLSRLFVRRLDIHKEAAVMLNDKYLTALSAYYDDTIMLLDSNAYKVTDYTEEQVSMNPFDGSVSGSKLNIANKKVLKLSVGAHTCKIGRYDDYNEGDVSSEGTRCALTSDGKSLIVKTEPNKLTEYTIGSKKQVVSATTTYPVYKFAMYGSKCVAVEKDADKLYLEILDFTLPDTFTAKVNDSLCVGESDTIKLNNSGAYKLDYTFKSSNPKVASVDSKGCINAWATGTAIITVKAKQINISKKLTINVKDSKESGIGSYSLGYSNGQISNNIHDDIYSGNYGGVTTSNLIQKTDGTYERVEYLDSKIVVEDYSNDFKLKSTKTINMELPLFGGFYSGSTYNYLVFGKENLEESKTAEVIRVVKYDKKWKRISCCKIKGVNTRIPFQSGGLDMAEAKGKLYIHTCHEMFTSDEGINHQANCTFVIKEKNMKLIDSCYEMMNMSNGYVSHSFMQYIKTDKKYVYRMDLGDLYPRAIAFSQTQLSDKINNPAGYGPVLKIPGSAGDNYTGYTLGGLELSDDNILVIGTGIHNTDSNSKNVWLTTITKQQTIVNTVWLTKYDEAGALTAKNAKLIKIKDNQFLVMWEEYNSKAETYITKMVLVDAEGKKVTKVASGNMSLSGCEPIVNSDGQVVWYVTNTSSPVFVTINPYKLGKIESDTSTVQLFSDCVVGTTVVCNNLKYLITGTNTASVVGTNNKYASRIVINSTILLNGKRYRVTAIDKNAFKGVAALQEVVICAKLESIGARAFYGCEGLQKVSFKSKAGLKELGTCAFANCKSLTGITLPANCSKLGAYVFGKCDKLKRIRIKSNTLTSKSIDEKAFKNIGEKTIIEVPENKLKLYKKIFKNKGLNSKVRITA